MNHFHNTIGLSGAALEAEDIRVAKQDEIILAMFKKFPRSGLTPFDVQNLTQKLFLNYPITSIRRAITNLEKNGNLVKSEKASAKGIYGKPNHVWKLAQ